MTEKQKRKRHDERETEKERIEKSLPALLEISSCVDRLVFGVKKTAGQPQ